MEAAADQIFAISEYHSLQITHRNSHQTSTYMSALKQMILLFNRAYHVKFCYFIADRLMKFASFTVQRRWNVW
jgi:hypothetical protein